MTDLHDLLSERGTDARLVSLIDDVAAAHPCAPLEGTRDTSSVPVVREQGGQVALYPMRRRLAIAVEPDSATHWALRVGALRVEAKTPRTHYLHVSAAQLDDPDTRAAVVEACAVALDTIGRRTGKTADDAAGVPRSWGTCEVHHLALNAFGDCDYCDGS